MGVLVLLDDLKLVFFYNLSVFYNLPYEHYCTIISGACFGGYLIFHSFFFFSLFYCSTHIF